MMPMIVVLVHHAEELEHEDVRGALSSIQESSSLFLMGLKEEHKLTQVALQGVIEGVTNLTQTWLSTLHAGVCGILRAAGIEPPTVPGLEEHFDSEGSFGRPFLGLETQHQQLSFYKKHFNFVVSHSSVSILAVNLLNRAVLAEVSDCNSY